MKNLTLENIAAVTAGTYHGDESKKHIEVSSIEIDSRKVQPGGLFVAIKGERADGHNFIKQVIDGGALAVISEQELPGNDFPYILVKSSLQAVKDIAEFYLKQLHIPVVGITGSVGKTSTKEMIYSVLRQKYRVLKTEGNFNNELGLPLTVFRLRDDDQIAVLEMGISHFGDMHRLAKIARPHTIIMTNIGCAHLENLKTRDGILKAKSEIFDFIEPDATIIVNGDDDKLSTIKDVQGIKPHTFGFDATNDFWADNMQSLGLKGTKCRLHTPAGIIDDVTVAMPGKHMVLNALAAAAAGIAYGLTLSQIKAGIEANESLAGRFSIIETGTFTIIDDCYNANPVSMKASLCALQDADTRKVAILGDMGELGANERQLHADVGSYAAKLRIDSFLCVGPLSESIASAIKAGDPTKEVHHFATKDDLLSQLDSLLRKGDTVLVKASHFMGFAQIVNYLKEK